MFDRAWLVTWTCYANWLPGDPRGFVSFRPNQLGERTIANEPDTEYDRDIRWLHQYCRSIQKHPMTRLTTAHATAVAAQFAETARYRGWILTATAVMANHVHIVTLVPGDPEPESLLHSFKSYASRRLNAEFGKRVWWTESGSTIKLPDEVAIRSATRYVMRQEYPLHVWYAPNWLPAVGFDGDAIPGEPPVPGEPPL